MDVLQGRELRLHKHKCKRAKERPIEVELPRGRKDNFKYPEGRRGGRGKFRQNARNPWQECEDTFRRASGQRMYGFCTGEFWVI